MPAYTLLSRPGCHLCEDMEAQLHSVFGERMAVDVVQVDHHPQWLAQYGLRIPVLLADDGSLVCEFELDEAAVRAHLSRR